MRRVASWLLIFLGAFLLTVALLAVTWAPGQVKRTPLDTDSVTRLTGDALIAGPNGLESTPVKATSTTRADSELSTDDVILFQSSSCLIRDPDGNAPDCVSADDPQRRLIAAGTTTFALNRVTALPENDFENLPAEAAPREGLVNKFPFDVEQRDYEFWDGFIGEAVPAVYQDEEEIDGLDTYRFLVTVTDGDIEITDGVAGKYSTEKTLWIEPRTGAIIRQSEQQVRTIAETGETFLELDYGFTDEQVAANVAAAKDNASNLSLLTRTLPIVAGILGLLALVGGILLLRGGRDSQPGQRPADDVTFDELRTSRRG